QTAGPGVFFQVSCHTNQPGETIAAQISISGFRQVTSAQFTLLWDPAVLRFESADDYGVIGILDSNFGARRTSSGQLAFAWDEASGLTLPDRATLFSVRFKVIGRAGAFSPLDLADALTQREV